MEKWPRLTLAMGGIRHPAPYGDGCSVGEGPDAGPGRCHTLDVMDAPRNFTAAVHQEDDWYVAQCLEVDVASQGRSIPEALSNLAEAVELYLDEVEDPQQHVAATPLVTSFQVPGAA